MRSRAIYGCAGTQLSAAERDFFRKTRPWGFILFARNISDVSQVKALVDQLRESVDDGLAPVLIDQEGGRVARLKPPLSATGPSPRIPPRSSRLGGPRFKA
jgi:beta-N-acetylhexosaminidase